MVTGSISSGGNHCILMRPNKVETPVQWFNMLQTVLAGFSGHTNSSYDAISQFKKNTCISLPMKL